MQRTSVPSAGAPQNLKALGAIAFFLASLVVAGVVVLLILLGTPGTREVVPEGSGSAENAGIKFGEYDRPSKDSIPQIEDPAEMVATVLWNLLIVLDPRDYTWSDEYLDGSSRNPILAADASRRGSLEASSALTSVGVVKKLEVHPAPDVLVSDGTVAMIVTLNWESPVYGDTGVTNIVVIVGRADRGIWEVISIDSSD